MGDHKRKTPAIPDPRGPVAFPQYGRLVPFPAPVAPSAPGISYRTVILVPPTDPAVVQSQRFFFPVQSVAPANPAIPFRLVGWQDAPFAPLVVPQRFQPPTYLRPYPSISMRYGFLSAREQAQTVAPLVFQFPYVPAAVSGIAIWKPLWVPRRRS